MSTNPPIVLSLVLTSGILFLTSCARIPGAFDASSSSASVTKNGPQFHLYFESAVAESRRSGKPIIAIFSSSGSKPCEEMKRDVYPSKEVSPYHDRFVWADIDADDSRNDALKEANQVNQLPHVSVVGFSGIPLTKPVVGVVSAKSFADVLSGIAK